MQYYFGGDGLDSCSIRQVRIPLVFMSDEEIASRLCFQDFEPEDALALLAFTREYDDLIELRDELREGKVNSYQRELDDAFYLPCDAATVVTMVNCRCCSRPGASAATPVDACRAEAMVSEVCDTMEARVPSVYMRAHVRHVLSTQRVVDARLCEECLGEACARVVEYHRQAILHPGEAIGALVATSLGEPTTQMTLNT